MKQFIIFFIIFLSFIFGIQASNGNAIDNFRNLEYEMIFESDNIFLEGENRKIIEAGKKANLYNSIRGSLKEKRLEAEDKKVLVEQEIFSLEKSIERLEGDIKSTLAYIEELNAEVVKTNSTIRGTKKTIEFITKKVQKSEENLKKYITHIYAKSNTLYNKNEVDNLKAILLSGKDIGQLLSDNHYKTLIQITGKKLLDQHRSYLRELYIKKIELEREMRGLKILRKEEVISKKSLSDKKALKEKYLVISKGEQAAYEAYIRNKIQIEREIKKKQLEEQLKFDQIKKELLGNYECEYVNITQQEDAKDYLSEKCFDLNRAIAAESRLKDEEVKNSNFLDWPVAPVKGISAHFNDAEYIQALGADHGAIDIPINQGTDIMAAADGYVIYLLSPKTEEYAYIALKHSNGYVTVYGHVSDILVSKYDFVERGEVFAKSGGSPGTNGAGYLSTGAHLHFEVFYEQELNDPLQFIDLSYLTIDNIPKKYTIKFEDDFRNRMGYAYKGVRKENDSVFRLSGTNEIERQNYLLQKYASREFRDWDIWVEESIDGGIDPTFVMCIGLAETGLGKNLKTPFNIGNVGNTDSGATIDFPNARSGIHSMVKGLNNKYLSQYDEIRDLSRYGNKDTSKPIYASSPDHWHNNIIKCMSAIKGKFVADNYRFRLK